MNRLRNLYRKFNKSTPQWMVKTKAEMLKEIEALDTEDLTPARRSFYQYELGKSEIKLSIRLVKHLLSLIISPLFVLYSIFCKPGEPIEIKHVIMSHVLEEVIPESIREEGFLRAPRGYSLLKSDLSFFFENVFRWAPHKPFYWFNILMKIAEYRYILNTYDTEEVVTSLEYAFASSVLTDFLERQGVRHVNVQHGDKLFNLRDSFFYFHKMFLWDNHYMMLFKELKAQIDRVDIELPPMLQSSVEADPDHDWTYYTQMDDEEAYQRLKPFLKSIKGVHMRVHPRYGNKRFVEEIFGLPIEHYIDIETSLSRTRGVIGIYSTVLYQGYLLGKEVLLDDLSNPTLFERLKGVDYLLIEKECQTLSEYLGVKQ